MGGLNLLHAPVKCVVWQGTSGQASSEVDCLCIASNQAIRCSHNIPGVSEVV